MIREPLYFFFTHFLFVQSPISTVCAMSLMVIEDYKAGKKVSIVEVVESVEDSSRAVSEDEDMVFKGMMEGVERGELGTGERVFDGQGFVIQIAAERSSTGE